MIKRVKHNKRQKRTPICSFTVKQNYGLAAILNLFFYFIFSIQRTMRGPLMLMLMMPKALVMLDLITVPSLKGDHVFDQ